MDTSNVTVAIVDTLQDKVSSLIAVLTGQNAVFTAYDITKQLRQENPTMDIPHLDVKEAVFEEWKQTFCDEYESTLTRLKIGQHAYVYHPANVSADSHPLADTPLIGAGFDTDTDSDTDLTVENRLNISRRFLRPMSLIPGKLVQVSAANGVMSLTPTTDTAGDVLVVNADGRLRLGEKILTRAFGTLPAKYRIAISSDKSVIKVQPED